MTTHVIIEGHINFKTLIPFLNKYKIFTRAEMEYLMNDFIPTADRVNNLITLCIPQFPLKNENGLCNFVRALNEAHEHGGHITIIEHLYNAAFPETIV